MASIHPGYRRAHGLFARPRWRRNGVAASVLLAAGIAVAAVLSQPAVFTGLAVSAGCSPTVHRGREHQSRRVAVSAEGKPQSLHVAAVGMKVAVNFVVRRVATGEVLDSTQTPIQFVCGSGDMPPNLDTGVRGLTSGDEFNLPVPQQPGLTMRVTVVEVTEGPPGVEVETLSPGDDSTRPQPTDWLTVHYTGTLAADGKKFDSSHDGGQPFEFQVGGKQVIRGLEQGIMKMSLGEKAKLHIPADLGYGPRGTPDGTIPPNSDLVFEIELLKVTPCANRGC